MPGDDGGVGGGGCCLTCRWAWNAGGNGGGAVSGMEKYVNDELTAGNLKIDLKYNK